MACLWGAVVATARADDTLAERRARVEQMTASQKAQLRRAQEEFNELPSEEQAKLDKLHEQLTEAEDADALRAMMDRYYEWVRRLPPWEQAELLNLPRAERVERVIQLMREECKDGPGPERRSPNRAVFGWGSGSRGPGSGGFLPEQLRGEDATELVQWLKTVAEQPEELERFVAHQKGVDEERVRSLLRDERIDPMRRAGGILHALFLSTGKDFDYDSETARRYLQEARSKLSPQAVEFMRDQDPRRQWFWISALIVRHHMHEWADTGRGFAPRSGHGGKPSISDEDLAQYLETLKKNNEQKLNYLLKLPPSRMEEELIGSYLNLRSSRSWDRNSWPGGSRGGGPGPSLGRGGPGSGRGMGRGGDGPRGGFPDRDGRSRSYSPDRRFGRPPQTPPEEERPPEDRRPFRPDRPAPDPDRSVPAQPREE